MSQEQIAKVLAEHRDWAHSHDTVMCIDCDWDAGPISIDHAASAFHTHQASVLAPLFAEAQAEALREAADDFERRVNVTVQMAAEQPDTDYSKEATQNAAGVKIAASVLRHKAGLLTAQADPEGRALVARIHERKAQG